MPHRAAVQAFPCAAHHPDHRERLRLQSARAVGLGASAGSLAPGRRADIVLVDLSGPHTRPVHGLAATLVHSARSADVRTTIVDGRVLVREPELLTERRKKCRKKFSARSDEFRIR